MLQAAVKISLERAVRDNDLVYCSPVPPANQLPPILGVGMVKLAAPTEVAEPVAWLMRGAAGMGPLFSALVPYGVHLALSEQLAVATRLARITEMQVYMMIEKIRSYEIWMANGKNSTVLPRGRLWSHGCRPQLSMRLVLYNRSTFPDLSKL